MFEKSLTIFEMGSELDYPFSACVSPAVETFGQGYGNSPQFLQGNRDGAIQMLVRYNPKCAGPLPSCVIQLLPNFARVHFLHQDLGGATRCLQHRGEVEDGIGCVGIPIHLLLA